jgi:sigma-E factor negative regulatory protein RseA
MSSAPDAHRIPDEEALGALMDGCSDAAAAEVACRAWRSDATARRRWHEWHLIGDALRSDELVAHAAHDTAFVARLRERLALEPTVLAPAQPPARRDVLRRRVWIGSAAVAAGFVAVAATLLAVQQPQGGGGGPQLVQAPAAAPGVVVAAPPAEPAAAEPQTVVINGQLIRDARLDQYLAAHKLHSTMGMPAALMRPAPVDGVRR